MVVDDTSVFGRDLDEIFLHVECLRIRVFAYQGICLSNPEGRSCLWMAPRSRQWHVTSACGLRRRVFALILKHVEYRGKMLIHVFAIKPQQNQIVAVDDTSVFGMHLDKILSPVEYLRVCIVASSSSLLLSSLEVSDTKSL